MQTMEVPTRDVGPGESESMSSIRRWCAPRENQDPPIVLEPEHPLMQQFQATLKLYLVKENDRMNTEIIELRANLKKNKQDYEVELGQKVFKLEQEVSHQRNMIVQYETTIDSAVKMRVEREENVNTHRENYKERAEKLNQEKRKDAQLCGELEALNLLYKQYEAWQGETDSELAVNQRISDKMAEEKKRLTQEKKDLDLMVLNLTTEVWKLESQILLLEDQTRIKVQEMESMGTIVSDGTVDLQALESEHRRLMQTWGSVIVNIQQQDRIYTAITSEYENVQAELQTLLTGIESIKKEIVEEMQRNETTTVLKERSANELARCGRLVQIEDNKQNNFEIDIAQATTAIQLTEKDLILEKMENTTLSSILKSLTREFEKLTEEKMNLENDTLDRLQERLTTDKAAEGMANEIRQLKEEARKNEIDILSIENRHAKLLLEIEKLKIINLQNVEILEEDKKLCAKKEAEITESENKIKYVLNEIDRKQAYLDRVFKKIAVLIDKQEGCELDPVQKKIQELEREIADSTKQSKQMQQDWLRMQGHVVQLTNQYQAQQSDLSLIRRQIRIMEQKNLKLENEKKRLIQEDAMVQRSLDSLQSQVDQLYKHKFEDQVHNQEVETEYNNMTLEYMAQLKEAEMEAMNIEEEIIQLENEKEELAIELHKIRREVLSWEKKGIVAIETKQKVDEEKSATGEIGRMKLEIHRMQVRHAEVSHTASRLATDLAHTVGRREAAAARARPRDAPQLTRLALLKRLSERRGDIKRVHQEIEVNKNIIATLTKEQEFLQQEMDDKKSAIFEVENDIRSLEKQAQECQSEKQKNLERIIRYQLYGQHCTSIASGRARPHSVKTEPPIAIEFYRQKRLTTQMQSLVKDLMDDLPDKRIVLMRILNTLTMEDEEMKLFEI